MAITQLWRIRNWPLLPAKDKVPYDPATLAKKAGWSHFRRPLTEDEWRVLEQLLSSGEGWQVGVVCGHNVVALDIDQEELPDLPGLEVNCWTHRTPRGGWHFVYERPPHPVGTTRRGPFEVKAEGGFLIIPPSPGYKGVCEEWPALEPLPRWPFHRLFELPPEAINLWALKPLPGQKDTTLSGFDYRLALVALYAGWSAPEVVQLLQAFRKVHKAPESDAYFARTVQKALVEARTQKRRDRVLPAEAANEFLEEEGRYWLYSPSRGVFFKYGFGYWKPVMPSDLRHHLRKVLPHRTELQRTSFANEVIDNIITHFVNNREDADERLEEALYEPKVIVFKDKTLDLDTMTFRQHSPDDYAQIRIPHPAPTEEPKSTLWRELLAEWVSEDVAAYLQQWAGYLMVPDTSLQAMLVLYGVGANGKSLFLYGIEKLLGEDNLAHVPLDRFAERFELAFLQYKLANIFADLDTRYIERTGTIKAFVAGDKVRAEYKGGIVFYYRPITRLVFSTNELPHASDISPGWYDRFRIVPFTRRFQRDPDANARLRAAIDAAVASGEVVWWALEGLRALRQYGWRESVEELRQAKNHFIAETNSVVAFLEEIATGGVATVVSTTGLYTAYTVWAAANGLRPVAKRRFLAALREQGYEIIPGAWCRDVGRSTSGVRIELDLAQAASYGLIVAASSQT